MASTLTCGQTYYKAPTEVVRVAVDFSGLLRQGESLTGTPTITPPVGITTASPAVSAAPEVINRQIVPAGRAVLFTLSSGTDGTTYSIKVSCGTSGSNTRECFVTVIVGTS